MVGRQVLILLIGVRVPVPEQMKYKNVGSTLMSGAFVILGNCLIECLFCGIL